MRRTPAWLAALLAGCWFGCGGSNPAGEVDAAPDAPVNADADAAADAFAWPDAPPPVPCGPDLQDNDPCAVQYELCAIPGGCCACGGIAGFCASVWICSTAAQNDPTCPAGIPPHLSDCTVTDEVTCEYCNGDIPVVSGCTSATFDLECDMTGHERCWRSYPQGAGCD